jgi:hypothetical protein
LNLSELRVGKDHPLTMSYPNYEQCLHFNAQLTFSNSGCTKIVKLWAPYWILNLTSLTQLQFSGANGALPFAGQNFDRNSPDPIVTDKHSTLTYSNSPSVSIKKIDANVVRQHAPCLAEFEEANNHLALTYELLFLLLFLYLLVVVLCSTSSSCLGPTPGVSISHSPYRKATMSYEPFR